MDRIRFGVQAGLVRSSTEWLEFARKVESSGFEALYVSDHRGISGSPFVALAAAATVTSTLRLGTYVCNTGVRDPLQVASDAAAVDVASDGRFVLGLGAGHTPVEWTMTGSRYPGARARVDRFGEFLEIVTRILNGEVVTFEGEYLQAADAFLLAPRPVQDRIPLLIGGNGERLLELSTRYADVISLTGLGRTLEGGHQHDADWSSGAIDRRVAVINESAPDAAEIRLDALVQNFEITKDRESAAIRVVGLAPSLTPAVVLQSPYALLGTVDEIVEQVGELRERWGFSSYVIRAEHLDASIPVVAALA